MEMRIARSLSRSAARDDERAPLRYHHDEDTVELAVYGVEVWGVLPYPGGLFDQPLHLLNDMFTYLNVRNEMKDDQQPAPPSSDTHEEMGEGVFRMEI